MSNPNRLKVYYAYTCPQCGGKQYRGSSARKCQYSFCQSRIYRIKGAKARTKPPAIFSGGA